MFIIKYHKKGFKTKYFGKSHKKDTLVSTKQSAYAIGENLREKFNKLESDTCTLIPLQVSEIAEVMYMDSMVLVKDIIW